MLGLDYVQYFMILRFGEKGLDAKYMHYGQMLTYWVDYILCPSLGCKIYLTFQVIKLDNNTKASLMEAC